MPKSTIYCFLIGALFVVASNLANSYDYRPIGILFGIMGAIIFPYGLWLHHRHARTEKARLALRR